MSPTAFDTSVSDKSHLVLRNDKVVSVLVKHKKCHVQSCDIVRCHTQSTEPIKSVHPLGCFTI